MDTAQNSSEKYITLKEACEGISYTPSFLRAEIRKGNLEGVKKGRVWKIQKKWLSEYVLQQAKEEHTSELQKSATFDLQEKSSIGEVLKSFFHFPVASLQHKVVSSVLLLLIAGSLTFGYLAPYAEANLSDQWGTFVSTIQKGATRSVSSAQHVVQSITDMGVRETLESVVDTQERITRGGKRLISNSVSTSKAFVRNALDINARLVKRIEAGTRVAWNTLGKLGSFSLVPSNSLPTLGNLLGGTGRVAGERTGESVIPAQVAPGRSPEGVAGIYTDSDDTPWYSNLWDSLSQFFGGTTVVIQQVEQPSREKNQRTHVRLPQSPGDILGEDTETIEENVAPTTPETKTVINTNTNTHTVTNTIVQKEIPEEVASLSVTGDLSAQTVTFEDLTVNNTLEVKKQFNVRGDSRLLGDLVVEGDTHLNGELYLKGIRSESVETHVVDTVRVFSNHIYSETGSIGTFGVTDLGVARSLNVGSDQDDTLTVDATATFNGPITFLDASGGTLVLTNVRDSIAFRVNDESADTTPFVIDADGKVGVGLASPVYTFDVVGSINYTGTLYQNGTAFSSGSWTDAGDYIYANNASSVVVTDTGRLGVGTTTPQEALHIDGGFVLGNTTSSP